MNTECFISQISRNSPDTIAAYVEKKDLELLSKIFSTKDESKNFISTKEKKFSITYFQLENIISALVNLLREKEIKAGNIVVVFPSYSIFSIALLFSLWRLNAVTAPLNPKEDNETLNYKINYLKPSFIIDDFNISRSNKNNYFYSDEIISHLHKPKKTLFFKWETESMSTILWTSGSTGNPKAIAHSLKHHTISAKAFQEIIHMSNASCYLMCLPLFHIAGLAILFRAFSIGASVSFTASKYITHISWVQTQLYRYLYCNQYLELQVDQLQAVILGGSAIEKKLIELGLKKKLPLYQSYGMTETASLVYLNRLTIVSNNKITQEGKTLNHARLKINSEKYISIICKSIGLGYYNRKGMIPIKNDEGVFHTSDIADFDKDNQLTIDGRKDNIFISRGENLQPELIEKKIKRLQFIKRVYIIPQKNTQHTTLPILYVEFDNDQKKNQLMKQLKEFIQSSIPKFQQPHKIHLIPIALQEESKLIRKKLIQLSQFNFNKRNID